MLKKIIRKIDEVFLAKSLSKQYGKYLNGKALSDLEYKIVSSYHKNNYCEISRLCDIYGSDKGELRKGGHPYPWPSHTYADFFLSIFSHSCMIFNSCLEKMQSIRHFFFHCLD